MQRVLELAGTTLLIMTAIAIVAGIYAGFFFSHPTGRYYIDSRETYTTAVMEDVRFGQDHIMYIGESGTAFRILQSLNSQKRRPAPKPVDAVVVPSGT